MTQDSLPTLIIGAGFTGLFAALHLRHQRYPSEIILIDPQERFVFKPMLYELLTEELPEDVVCPRYTALLQGSDIVWLQERVEQVDLQQKQVRLASGNSYSYQNLVLAVGSVQGYLGTPGAAEHSFAFRSREEAIGLREHLKACLAQALQTEDPQEKQALLTVVIVGGGPSGVEMAATLGDLLPSWYAAMGGQIRDLKLVLFNHAPQILAGDANAHLQKDALQALKQRTIPIELKLGTGVKSVTGDRLTYQTGQEAIASLATHTTIWTAGTALNPLIEALKVQISPENLAKHGQLVVSPTLQLPDFPEVLAAGDCVQVQGQHQPALAQVAYQQGATIAHNLIALSQGKPLQISNARLRGTLMKLGLHNGVANLFDKVQIPGQAGDLLRNATYLEMLPTPLHNFQATAEWLRQETIDRYHHPQPLSSEQLKLLSLSPQERQHYQQVKLLAILVPLGLAIATWIGFQTPPNERFPTPNHPTRPAR